MISKRYLKWEKLSVARFELRSNFSGPSVPKLCPTSKTSSKKCKLASDSFFEFTELPFSFDPDSKKKLFSRELKLPDTRQALTQKRVTLTRPWFRLLKADDASSHEMKKIVGWTLGGVRRVQPSVDCHPLTHTARTPTHSHTLTHTQHMHPHSHPHTQHTTHLHLQTRTLTHITLKRPGP